MAREQLVLRDERTATDRRVLTVTLRDDGGLLIEGWDLGDGVEAYFGTGYIEYEWTTEVSAAEIPKLIAALGGAEDAGILDVIRDTCMSMPALLDLTIRAAGIKTEFWNRYGR